MTEYNLPDYWIYDDDGFLRREKNVSEDGARDLEKQGYTIILAPKNSRDPVDFAKPGYFGSF